MHDEPTIGLTLPAHVTRVIDGDTLEVEIKRTLRIRLLDCWAAEQKEPSGPEATAKLKQLALDRPCVVTIPLEVQGKFGDAMTFGRVLAYVSVDGCDLSKAMVDLGLATTAKAK